MVSVDLTLNIEYGMNIVETSKKVQEKVKAAIENMTGLEVADVNIHIASAWAMENKKKQVSGKRKVNLSFFFYECLRELAFLCRDFRELQIVG